MAVYSLGQMFIICKATTPIRRIADTGPNQGAAITCNIQNVKKKLHKWLQLWIDKYYSKHPICK